ncbi:MAG: glycosyltransferase family 4 protein [Actinobacteria bacterium]|nr:glycosyltransferase family 4 protein [Actinomycetota bacterium]
MRILIVSSLWPPRVLGGAELYAYDLAAHLRAAGHEVAAVTWGVDGDDVVAVVPPWPYPIDEYTSKNAAQRALMHSRDIFNVSARKALDRALRTFRPDVVHSHGVPGMSGSVLALPSQRGVPHVHTIHDYWLLCQRLSMVKRSGVACEQRCASCLAICAVRNATIARHAPQILLAVSEAVAREHEVLGWARTRLRVVPNPVEPMTGVTRPDARSDRPLTFGYIGQVARHKGVHTLVDAFTAFAASRNGSARPPRLLIAGTGALRDELSLRTPPSVEWLGWVDDAGKRGFYSAVDCLVVPSEWKDPAPLVVNEARGIGVPVIGARAGGIPELIAPESTPLLFPSGDRVALQERLETFATNPVAYASPAGSRLAGWDVHLERVLTAYEDARVSRAASRPT